MNGITKYQINGIFSDEHSVIPSLSKDQPPEDDHYLLGRKHIKKARHPERSRGISSACGGGL
jgi:hypothetical protein